jgi:hypothetical protein
MLTIVERRIRATVSGGKRAACGRLASRAFCSALVPTGGASDRARPFPPAEEERVDRTVVLVSLGLSGSWCRTQSPKGAKSRRSQANEGVLARGSWRETVDSSTRFVAHGWSRPPDARSAALGRRALVRSWKAESLLGRLACPTRPRSEQVDTAIADLAFPICRAPL